MLSALLCGSRCSTLPRFVCKSFALPTKGHWLPPLGTSCSAVLSFQLLCVPFVALDPCYAPRTPPTPAPWQSTIAQGMSHSASLFCTLKKTARVLLEGMSRLHCSSVIIRGFSCQENWPQHSLLYYPYSSFQILRADTLAPPVAFRLC